MNISKHFLFALIIFLIAFNGCKEENTTEPETNPQNYLYEGIAIVKTSHSRAEYMVNDPKGNTIYFDYGNNYVKKAVCRSSDGNWLEMQFNENGIPERVITKNYIVLINNIANNKADFASIDLNTNEIKLYRDIDFKINSGNQINFKQNSIYWYGEVAQDLKIASMSLQAFSLAAFYIGVAPGPHSPVALAFSGVSLSLSVLAAVSANHFEELENSSLAFSVGADAIGCGGGGYVECISLGTSISSEVVALAANHQDEIQLAQGALEYGHGDIQVTLTWDNSADLDLWVTDPNGEKVYWNNALSSSGGRLDVDDRNGFGPENVYWPTNQAPNGTYMVEIDHYDGTSPSNYQLLINAFGTISNFSGQISSNQTVFIAQFSSGGSHNKVHIKYLKPNILSKQK